MLMRAFSFPLSVLRVFLWMFFYSDFLSWFQLGHDGILFCDNRLFAEKSLLVFTPVLSHKL